MKWTPRDLTFSSANIAYLESCDHSWCEVSLVGFHWWTQAFVHFGVREAYDCSYFLAISPKGSAMRLAIAD